MNTLQIYVDDREKKIIPLLKAHKNSKGFKITVKRLVIGDYCIYYKDKLLMCVERKSWIDLGSSITDGRIANVEKLKIARNETECKIIYLIEGKGHMTCKKMLPKMRIPFKCLRSHLDHLAIRDNVIIIRSINYQDTADRLIDLMENFCTLYKNLNDVLSPEELIKYNNQESAGGKDEEKKSQPIDKEQLEEKIVFRKIDKTDQSIGMEIWCSIYGINHNTYEMLQEKYSIHDFILGNVLVDDLKDVKYPSGHTLGKRKSQRIIDSAQVKKIQIKMLSRIPGITKKTAEEILFKIRFTDIVNGATSIQTLANYKKNTTSGKKRLGNKIAQRIIHHFRQPTEPDTETDSHHESDYEDSSDDNSS